MRYLPLIALLFTLLSCGGDVPPPPPAMPPLTDLPLVPLPVEMADLEGYLYTDGETVYDNAGADAGAMAYWKSKGLPSLPVETVLDATLTLKQGAYLVFISPEGVILSAGDQEGLINAVTTMAQVIAFSPRTDRGLFLPAGTITDQPRYAYRGFMLDVARHFMGVDTVKQVIDRISDYKINHLHLHLSDDQGWRIEIKSWPKLTEIGGRYEVSDLSVEALAREDYEVAGKGETPDPNRRTGGFYTQEQYVEIVGYAAARGITVVPEIDMPGHTNAALNAYAELNGDGKAREPFTGTAVGFSTLDANKEITYKFVDDVVREIAAITPGPYFHLGGDESAVTPHDDYVKFVQRAQEIIISHGKQPMGWDEVAVAGLSEGTVPQLWNHTEYALMAKEKGNKVLFSPATRTYLDMQYDTLSRIGLHWAAYIEVDSAYLWNPATLVDGIDDGDIIGVEAPLWTETVRSLEDIDYLVFPRLLALAELAWTPQLKRDYKDFLRRLSPQQTWLKERGIATYDTSVLR